MNYVIKSQYNGESKPILSTIEFGLTYPLKSVYTSEVFIRSVSCFLRMLQSGSWKIKTYYITILDPEHHQLIQEYVDFYEFIMEQIRIVNYFTPYYDFGRKFLDCNLYTEEEFNNKAILRLAVKRFQYLSSLTIKY